jgi:transposase
MEDSTHINETGPKAMRGADIQQDTLFSTVIPEERVPADHPLRPIREMVNKALKDLDTDFNALYSDLGRDSFPPEKQLRAQLLMVFYAIRSERQLMEQIDYNLMFRWFVGFSMGDKVWTTTRPGGRRQGDPGDGHGRKVGCCCSCGRARQEPADHAGRGQKL